MLLRDITKVWISRDTPVNSHGEYTSSWAYTGVAYLNIQQDVTELDRKSSGEVDYGIYRARATHDYDIQKGDGVSLTDITQAESITPDYRVLDITKIADTLMYRMEAYNGD